MLSGSNSWLSEAGPSRKGQRSRSLRQYEVWSSKIQAAAITKTYMVFTCSASSSQIALVSVVAVAVAVTNSKKKQSIVGGKGAGEGG